jgi:hypothetical protein
LAWSKINDPNTVEDDTYTEKKKKETVKTDEKEYKTECPIFEAEKHNPLITPVLTNDNKIKRIYSLNLNTYDKGVKPYYPSMDPNALGGELKNKSKKNVKAIEREKEKNSNSNNILEKFRQEYNYIEDA